MNNHLDVDSGDVIRLVLQFLKENGLLSSMQQLQKESGITLNTVDNVDTFLNDIRHGRWDLVFTQIGVLKLPLDKLSDLYEHVVYELLEASERDLAKEMVKFSEPLLVLKATHPDRYLRLETFCKRPYFSAADVYEMGTSKESRRQDIALSLANEVSSVEPSRLLSLLGQALKFQQAEGILPQGNNFDLFRNNRKAAKRDIDEKITNNTAGALSTVKEHRPTVVIYSPDGHQFILSGVTGNIEVWDTESRQIRDDLEYQHNDQFMNQGSNVTSGIFSRDGDHIALGDTAGTIKIWKISTGQCVKTFSQAHRGSISSICFARDGTQLLSASSDHTARVHGLKSGRAIKEFRGHTAYVSCALYTKDASTNVITSSGDGTIRLWDSKTTDCLLTVRPGLSSLTASIVDIPIHTMRFIPGSVDELMVCTNSSKVFIMNTSGQIIQNLNSGKKSGGDFVAATISSQGKWLYCAGEDKAIYVFDSKSGKLEEVMHLNITNEIVQLVHHPQRNYLTVVCGNGSVILFSGN